METQTKHRKAQTRIKFSCNPSWYQLNKVTALTAAPLLFHTVCFNLWELQVSEFAKIFKFQAVAHLLYRF